ncbi:SAV_915 family protein [Kitasatospora sp. NPDC048365]|uniref:SAV_915 family protein n=1 Tax=Kitasatospora sp. NPDC048365 TaxID=3364050 RepID=UPI00372329AD
MTTDEHGTPAATCDHALCHVPVRSAGPVQVLRVFRRRDGSRCAVAFSTAEALHALLGAGQETAELTEPALRALTEPLGIRHLVLDPTIVAPPAATDRAPIRPAPSPSGPAQPLPGPAEQPSNPVLTRSVA